MSTRRQFLTGTAGVCSLGPIAPALWRRAARAAEARRDAPVLVVIELSGGNDGLNTVVPYADDIYHKNRPTLRIEPGKILKLNDRVGLHPALKELHRVWEGGKLAVVQGVGYPHPNRSHFRSMEIWQTGSVGPAAPAGWLGRVGDSHPGFELCHVGQGTVPRAVQGRKVFAQSLSSVADYHVAQGASIPSREGEGPATPLLDEVRRRYATTQELAQRLQTLQCQSTANHSVADTLDGRLETIRRLIEADTQFRIFYTSQDGFDTHAGQRFPHEQLLRTMGQAVASFLNRLKSSKLDERVLVLVFSEFGRRLKENQSAGTDHGTAAPVLVAGPAVKAGVVGPHPNLAALDDTGDPRFTIDFRDAYATLLHRWLDIDPEPILGKRDAKLNLL